MSGLRQRRGGNSSGQEPTEDRKPEQFEEEEHPPMPSAQRMASLVAEETNTIYMAAACLFLSTVTSLATPAFFGQAIDVINSGDTTFGKSDLYWNAGGLLLATALGFVFQFFSTFHFQMAGERIVARLRKKLFKAILAQEVAFFDTNRSGALVNSLTSDTTMVKDAVTINLMMLLKHLATVVGGILYLIWLSPKLALVVMIVVPLVVVVMQVQGGKLQFGQMKCHMLFGDAVGVAMEALHNVQTVKSFSREDTQSEMYDDKVDKSVAATRQVSLDMGLYQSLMSTASTLAILVLMVWGGGMVLDGVLTAGVLTSFMQFTSIVGGSMGELTQGQTMFMQAMGASARIFQVLDRVPTIPKEGGKKLENFQGKVQLKRVGFAYPSRPDQNVLDDLSLSLEPGTVSALVGPSGSGKSTTMALIERLYDASWGEILIDGNPIQDLDLQDLHKHIAIVSQEPVLFQMSIYDNICYGKGKENVTREQVEAAAKAANAVDFILELKDGYDTKLGEGGRDLSGGQKQRIAIARAVLMDPKVLLLDEATSALDAESEFQVQQALDRLMLGRTVLVIAHRLSTVQNAHCVHVCEKGKVVEKGTHAELLAQSGVYAKLVKRQLKGSLGGESQETVSEAE